MKGLQDEKPFQGAVRTEMFQEVRVKSRHFRVEKGLYLKVSCDLLLLLWEKAGMRA